MALRDEKTNKVFNKKNLIGGFIVLLMVSSILAVFQGNNVVTRFNDFKIKQITANEYKVKIKGEQQTFNFHPQNIAYIQIAPEIITILKTSKMQYITFNPEDPLINEIEYMRYIFETQYPKSFSTFISAGVINQTGPYAQLPLITCVNATEHIPVIYIYKANITQIENENNCIKVQATTTYNVREILDRMRYGLFGVIQ